MDFLRYQFQECLEKGCKLKTIFKIRYSHFKYQMIFFGRSNILVSFQDYINKILAKKSNIFVIVYCNNIIIYTKDVDHECHLMSFQKAEKVQLFLLI